MTWPWFTQGFSEGCQLLTSGLGDQVGRGNHNSEEGAALEGLVVPDALLLRQLHCEAVPALAPALAVPLRQHALHRKRSVGHPQYLGLQARRNTLTQLIVMSACYQLQSSEVRKRVLAFS